MDNTSGTVPATPAPATAAQITATTIPAEHQSALDRAKEFLASALKEIESIPANIEHELSWLKTFAASKF